MTPVRPRRQPTQLDELKTQRLEVCDVAVQRGPIGDRTHQQRVGARRNALERLQHFGYRERHPARDPEGVVIFHVGLPFRRIACKLMVGVSG